MKAERIETDVLVIGGGAAGCSAALTADERGADVLMVVKGKMGRSGATPLASCIATAGHFPGPYPLLKRLKKLYSRLVDAIGLPLPPAYAEHLKLLIGYHYWLVDQDYFLDCALWVDKVFFPSLETTGLYLLRDEQGQLEVPPDNSYYVIHSHGMTGYQFGESRRKEVLARPIKVLEEASVFSLLRGDDGEVNGAMVLDYLRGRLYAVAAKTTILATGHTNWLATRATGTREMAANGLAMAVAAGAELQNLELQWFHAGDMANPDSWMRLHHFPNPLTGTSHQAAMVNAEGEMYMKTQDYDTVVPYTIQMKELARQVEKGTASWEGDNFTDYSLVEPEMLQKYQYHWEFYEKLGLDMTRDRLESKMTWHMSSGGVRADTSTLKTNVPGLYIAGAVGGHIIGGVPFCTFDGSIAGEHAASEASRLSSPPLSSDEVEAAQTRINALLSPPHAQRNEPTFSPIQVKKQIREIVWRGMMFEKTATGLEQALAELAAVREECLSNLRLRNQSVRYNTDLIDALDIEDMLDVCEMAAHASRAREESRGPHYRKDFPITDNDNWIKHIVVSRDAAGVKTRFEPVRQKYVRPDPGKLDI